MRVFEIELDSNQSSSEEENDFAEIYIQLCSLYALDILV